MHTFGSLIQICVALGLLNVWVLRFNRPTPYRGGNAQNMPEEFAVYGLSRSFCWLVGALKLTAAALLLAGLFQPSCTFAASAILMVLMAGAVLMHFKVGDPLKKALPALLMLVLSVILFASHYS